MFLDAACSGIGRSTGQQLDALRRQLGVGIDPAFDYSSMTELQKKLTEKKKEKKANAPTSEDAGPTSGLEQLRHALREVMGAGAVVEEPEHDEANKTALGGHGAGPQPMEARQSREQKRPSPTFLTRSRDAIAKMDVENRFRAPPVGSYRPKADLCQPRLQGSVEFGFREPNRSRKSVALEREVARLQAEGEPCDHLLKKGSSVELLDDPPDRARPRRVCLVDLAKATTRPDLTKSAGITYNVNSFTAGVMDGDLACSQLKRNPSWDFAKLSVAEPKQRESYFQPGQYKVDVGAVRPRQDQKNIPFDKQRARKPPREVVGRVEIIARPGAHLPDRSLSRSCPLLSTERKVQVPDLSKYTVRKEIIDKKPDFHRAGDPEIDQMVLQSSLAYDARDADRLMRPRLLETEDFNRSLKREQHLRTQRKYGEDISMQRARDNLTRGPLSVELLTDIDDSPQFRRRVLTADFNHMAGRDCEKKHVDSPPRNRNQGKATRFERELRDGDARCEKQVLSPLAGGISELRATRTYDALAMAEHPG